MANPFGMANIVQRKHLGRNDLATGINYNRQWPDLFAMIRTLLAGRLGDDERFNVTLIRKTIAQWIDAQQPRSGPEQLRLFLLREAHDAEFVFDLHCDVDSLLHIFTSHRADARTAGSRRLDGRRRRPHRDRQRRRFIR